VAELPSGTVTFLFTDLESSTRLWEEQADAMRGALARHDELIRDAIASNSGYVVKATGDGFHAAFATAQDAVSAAVQAQRALGEERWQETGPLRVRMGVHTGSAEQRDGDYFGPALNRAARLMGVAHGGQVVMSQAAADLARDALHEDVQLTDLGEHRLRDLSRPEHVYQVNAPGLLREFASLTSLDAFPGNLPLQVSSFVGRDRELARVAEALDEARVVTLTGVGGVGKTRLAYQVAADVLPRFREGAWLCELAAVRDPAGVVDAVATIFGVTVRAGQTLEDALVEFLGTKQLLLIVDNSEHLLEAVAELVERIERACPRVVVLATSREGLAVDGERVVPIPSLPGPPADASLEDVARAEAVHLFVDRARGVDPDFTLTAQNAAAVVQVCRRLDGVPLAIELAAARVTAMNLAELARGLDRRFETLAGGRRRAVQRHQTLRAAIDWSYDLLSEPEQRLLARLAVFAGGCTRDAAEAVCAGEPIERARVFELLAGLVARSLVVAEREGPETRYRLLETIREYAEERLGEWHETEALRRRHAEYYTELAGRISEMMRGPEQIEAGRRFVAEHENLIAARNHAIDGNDVDLALRLARNMPLPTTQIGYAMYVQVDPILELPGAAQHELYPFGLVVSAGQASASGDRRVAETRCAEALATVGRFGSDPDRIVEQIAANVHANLAFSAGAVHEAATHMERSIEIARSAGRDADVAMSLGSAAMFHVMAGDSDAAVRLATEGLALSRQIGMPTPIAYSLTALAGALADDDRERARALLRESLELEARLDYETWGEVTQAALISARLQDWAQALDLASRAIRHLHWIGERPLLGAMFNITARVLGPNDAESAAVIQGAAYSFATTATHLPAAPDPARTPPPETIPVDAGRSGTASFVTDLRRETTGLLRERLGEERLRVLRAEGRAMNTDEAVAYTLEAIGRQEPFTRSPRG
jgi:predicted ATPase/class 3 adenylate cyclase